MLKTVWTVISKRQEVMLPWEPNDPKEQEVYMTYKNYLGGHRFADVQAKV